MWVQVPPRGQIKSNGKKTIINLRSEKEDQKGRRSRENQELEQQVF
jgi:hypothetical protein